MLIWAQETFIIINIETLYKLLYVFQYSMMNRKLLTGSVEENLL